MHGLATFVVSFAVVSVKGWSLQKVPSNSNDSVMIVPGPGLDIAPGEWDIVKSADGC